VLNLFSFGAECFSFFFILSDFDPNTIFQAFFGGAPGGFGGFPFGGPGGM